MLAKNAARNMLVLSIALNLLFLALALAWVSSKGGYLYVFEKIGLAPTVQLRHDWMIDDTERMAAYPRTRDEIVFLGDSITGGGHWAEYFSVIRNRGIGAERTAGALERLEEAIGAQPRGLFIHLGTNGLADEIAPAEVADNFREILDRTTSRSPETKMYIVGLMPINLEMRNDALHRKKQKNIPILNAMLREISAERDQVTYFDAYDQVADENGNLKHELTVDGLHLNPRGYEVIMREYLPFVAEVHPWMPVYLD